MVLFTNLGRYIWKVQSNYDVSEERIVMNNKLITFGKLLKIFSLHRVAHIIQPSVNLRITYSHSIRCSDMANFDRIVHYLNKIRIVISPELFFSLYSDRIPYEGQILLMTFDDGLLSSYRAVKEVLDRYQIKAVFFVPTGILELKSEKEMKYFAAKNLYYNLYKQDSLLPDEYQFMTADHLHELSSNGHTICPHTHSHVLLRDINDEETAQRELIRPKEILENLLHKKIRAFAFPVGTERQGGGYAFDYIRRNYEFCFTALNGVNTSKTDPHLLHRDCVPAEAPLSYIRMVMEGTYDLFYMLKMSQLRKISSSQSDAL
jgi:peptidoglycan/xylan/chitin deacetylase (PgdA/CDA1 family)